MVTTDHAAEARKELDRLTSAFARATDQVDEERAPLQAAVVRHLMDRTARPGRVSDHTPWDRVHIGRIASEADVPPLKGPNASGPAPVYDDDAETAALAELDKLTDAFTKAEARRDKARDALHAAIVQHYTNRTLPPGEMATHTPYDRNHIQRIVKAAGAPGLRSKKS